MANFKFKTVIASGAVYACERFQVIAYNRDGSQSRLFAAGTLADLIAGYAKKIERMNAHPGTVEVMKSYTTIFAVDSNAPVGSRLFDLPYFA
jgi:hypothetical protein